MTAPARISQADMERATRALAKSGAPGRVVMDLAKQRIEIIIGESALEPAPAAASAEVWPDDDI